MVDGWQRDWCEPENLAKAAYFASEVARRLRRVRHLRRAQHGVASTPG